VIDLFCANSPERFWRLQTDLNEEQWGAAINAARPALRLDHLEDDLEGLLYAVLGEGQFGDKHWRLGPSRRAYYLLKPILPRVLVKRLRRLAGPLTRRKAALEWPIEDRYVRFQWEILRTLLNSLEGRPCRMVHFWPDGLRFALVLTHDIETSAGQDMVREVADLEEGLGFRSSFNFVPERYRVDKGLIRDLRERGFEIGVHGLRHDGRLFRSQAEFTRRAQRINQYLKEFEAVGFRSPLTHRHPEWMQALEIEYDLSFFDTDPYEPIPGGTMSIWPFIMGRFVELPYTLAQDYTLTAVLGEKTPRIWLQKVEFIRLFFGMALVNTHPDYLRAPDSWRIYSEFLKEMSNANDFWHALPRDAARWWRARQSSGSLDALPGAVISQAKVFQGGLMIEPMTGAQSPGGNLL